MSARRMTWKPIRASISHAGMKSHTLGTIIMAGGDPAGDSPRSWPLRPCPGPILRMVYLDLLILEELSRAPAHGYALNRAFGRRRLRVAPSTVYTALRRLERDGLITGRW